MTDDAGIGVFRGQFLEQSEHGGFLSLGPSIDRTSLLIQASFIANTKRAAVVMTGMSPTDVLWKDRDNGTIATNVIVVGGLAKATHSSRNQGFNTERFVAVSGAAVNNEQFDCVML